MITILFRTNEDNLSSKLCLDTATAIYMSPDDKIIVETIGEIDYISANTITVEHFDELLGTGLREGKLNLSAADYGLFDIYEPIENIDPEEDDDE